MLTNPNIAELSITFGSLALGIAVVRDLMQLDASRAICYFIPCADALSLCGFGSRAIGLKRPCRGECSLQEYAVAFVREDRGVFRYGRAQSARVIEVSVRENDVFDR